MFTILLSHSNNNAYDYDTILVLYWGEQFVIYRIASKSF